MKKLLSGVPKEVYIFSFLYFIFQLIDGLNYPIFRDEFYYIDCAKHFSFGYVDHPAFSILILKIWITIFGDSQLSIRIIPALLGSFLFILCAGINKELGGSKFSLYLSIVCLAFVPINLGNFSYYSMNSWEIVIWTLLFYFLIRLINSDDKKYWIFFAITAGIGFNNKIGILIFLTAAFVSLLISKERENLKRKYLWIGMGIIILFALPYTIWNFLNDFATQQFISNAAKYKNADYSVASFLQSQITDYRPTNFIFCILGLFSLLFGALKKYRMLAFVFIISFVLFMMNKAKPYYLEGLYPFLITAGSVTVIAFFERKNLNKLKYVLLVLIFVLGLVTVPFAVPVLSPDKFIEYSNSLGVKSESSEKHEQGILPQFYADRFGWTELTDKIAVLYNSLPENEKKYTGILTNNYGEAGAINYYGRKYNLPETFSGHNNHFIWRKERKDSVSTLIIIGGEKEDYLKDFEEVIQVDSTFNKYAMPYENNLPIYLCKKMKIGIQEMLKKEKHYI